MKKLTVVLILLTFFLNTAVASPAGQGGGTESDAEETNISTIILIAVVAGVSWLLVSDILADKSVESQDALSGIVEEPVTYEDTGINWESVLDETQEAPVPVVAFSVFNVDNGRELTSYFTALLQQDEEIFYTIQGTPIALGSMSPSEAAATGLSFVDCDWFITGDNTGVQLFSRNSDQPVWQFESLNPDSNAVRAAAASFRDFADGDTE